MINKFRTLSVCVFLCVFSTTQEIIKHSFVRKKSYEEKVAVMMLLTCSKLKLNYLKGDKKKRSLFTS